MKEAARKPCWTELQYVAPKRLGRLNRPGTFRVLSQASASPSGKCLQTERRPRDKQSRRSSKEIVVIASVVVSSPRPERSSGIRSEGNSREVVGYSAGWGCR